MLISKTYKYKLKLTSAQELEVISWLHTCRAIYNLALDTKIYAYKSQKVSFSCYDLQAQLTELKREKGYEWIKQVPSQTLQNVIERMDFSYKSFFRGGGFPKFKRKGDYSSVVLKGVRMDDISNRIIVPKLGSVKFFKSRELKGDIRRATITKETGGFFISILTEQAVNVNHIEYHSDSQAVGIDVGINYFLVSSDGEYVENPRFINTHKSEMRVLQRKLARQQKGGYNWQKTKNRIAKLHAKTKNQRLGFLHKTANQLLNSYDFIVVEKLQLKNMTKSAKGNTENPGKNVKQKSGLNKSLLDLGIGMFFDIIKYKSIWQGKTLIQVDPKYTSQKCSTCGHTCRENRQTQKLFVCVNCGYTTNADENASNNILRAGSSHFRKREAIACA